MVEKSCPKNQYGFDDSTFQANLDRLLDTHPDVDDFLAGIPDDTAGKDCDPGVDGPDKLKGRCHVTKKSSARSRCVAACEAFISLLLLKQK